MYVAKVRKTKIRENQYIILIKSEEKKLYCKEEKDTRNFLNEHI